MNYNKAEFYTSYGLASQLPASDVPEITFVGRSNVGKSSLINKILNRKTLARVSSVPGKTATINYYTVDNIFFVDLPGYGYAKRSKSEVERWSKLIEGYFKQGKSIKLVTQLVDFRHPPTSDDLIMIDYLKQMNIPFVIVLTKADKLKPTERKKRRDSIKTEIPESDNITCIEFSTVTGEGVDEIKALIERLAKPI